MNDNKCKCSKGPSGNNPNCMRPGHSAKSLGLSITKPKTKIPPLKNGQYFIDPPGSLSQFQG